MEVGIKGEGGIEDEDEGKKKGSGSRRTSAVAMVLEVIVTKKPEKNKRFSSQQWILLVFFSLIDFLAAVTISMQAPFYPAEAERKGATAAEYGLVFGIFEFTVFIVSPIYGKFMNRIGPQNLFSASILVNSLAVVCFGMMDWVNDRTWFISLCLTCRVFEGLACAGFFTSTFVLIACEFPDNVATIFASLETFIGLGLIAGPTLGAAVYTIGGFPLPFFTVGTCTFLTGVASILVMPKSKKANNLDGTEQQGYGVWTIMKIPSVALAALSIVSTAMSLGFLSSTLEPHIRRFELSPLLTGLIFVVNGGVYAISAPLCGLICDKVKKPAYVTIVGNLLICTSYILIGPAIFVPVDTILWVTIVGLLIHGLGLSGCFVSTFIVGLRDSMANGLPDNIATYAVVSGLWQSMISLGAFIGPSAGGLLYDTVGFREGSWLILIMSAIAGMTIVMYECFCSSPNAKSTAGTAEESQPLLQEQQQQPVSAASPSNDFEESCAVRPAASSSSYGSTSYGS